MDKDYLDFDLSKSEEEQNSTPLNCNLPDARARANTPDIAVPFIHLVNRVRCNPKLYASRYLTLLQRQRDE